MFRFLLRFASVEILQQSFVFGDLCASERTGARSLTGCERKSERSVLRRAGYSNPPY